MVEFNLFTDLMIFIIGFGIGFLIAMGMAVKIISDKHDLRKELEKVKEQRDFYSYLIQANRIPVNVTSIESERDKDYFQAL